MRVTDEPEVNARALWDDASSTCYVEFTLGMIVWLDGVAATLASHVARDFEAAPHPPLVLDPNAEDWRVVFQKRLDLCTEQLPKGFHGAYESFFQKAAIGVCLHEFSHIARGHLDWSRANAGSGEINENGLRRTKASLSASQARALEFDADMFAAQLIAHLAINPPEFLSRWKIGTPTENLIETLLGLVLFFVSVEAENIKSGEDVADYPKPLLRMIVMLSYMEPIWSKAHPEGGFWQEVFGGALSVLQLFEAIYPEIDLLRQLNERYINAALKQETNEISDDLIKLQDALLEFAFEYTGPWEFETG